MPEQATIERARQDKRAGKSASTQAGEFVREEIHHIREGKHGARSTEQAIAIGLSKARRAGVKLPAPKRGKTSAATRKRAEADLEKARTGDGETSLTRSRATRSVLQEEGTAAASEASLARHARSAARARSEDERSEAAQKAARTKGAAGRKAAAEKAARTRKKAAARVGAKRKAASLDRSRAARPRGVREFRRGRP
jgi:hypothetical protein